jgi:hypothetical protein
MNIIAYIALVLGSGIVGVALSFVTLFTWRRFDADPTVAGAYVAMFMLSALPVFAVSAAIAAFCFRKLLS